jgi:hypothetical protein
MTVTQGKLEQFNLAGATYSDSILVGTKESSYRGYEDETNTFSSAISPVSGPIAPALHTRR